MAPAPSASSRAIERPPPGRAPVWAGEAAQTIVASQPCSAARASSARAAASLLTSAPPSTAGAGAGAVEAVLLAAEEVAGKPIPERSRLIHAGRGDDGRHTPLQQRDDGRRRPQDVHHGERGAGVLYQAGQQRYVYAQFGFP